MKEGPDIARIAALIGDPARANILGALMAGHALTATELAAEAGVTPQTASSHLAQLTQGALLSVLAQGRHRYFTLASPEVARAVEALMGLAAAAGQLRHRPGPKDTALRAARRCYHHLAGSAGVQVHDSLAQSGHLTHDASGLRLTDAGLAHLRAFGLILDSNESQCRTCLDWSERRPHLGGKAGRALLRQMQALGWLRPLEGSRALVFTARGQSAFATAFPVAKG
ncbi:helix-turn-helix transcriptional regulator [Tabrizicola sp.]|uniref:ArsR/SmtB family transcription factor n=1 Tax=Tabrizicola sp. TaxID=2005166 RepID=UPI00286C9481|nr:helix-turn-helix transcriptional regulator [Tabrizicola sp.]